MRRRTLSVVTCWPRTRRQLPMLVPAANSRPPILGAMHVALAQQGLLRIARLIEAKQRVVAGATEMSVERSAFLFAIGLAH